MPLTAAEEGSLLTIGLISSAVSFCGSALIVLSHCLVPRLRKFAFRLVLYLAICDIGCEVSQFLGTPSEGSVECTTQAVLFSFFSTASILWTSCIARLLYLTVHRPRQAITLRVRESWLHFFSWGVAAFLAMLPATTRDYGRAGTWCWLRNSGPTGEAWRYIQFYIPLWIVAVYSLTVYFMVASTLRRAAARTSTPVSLYYPAVLVFCWSAATVNRIQNSVRPSAPIYGLYAAHVVTGNLQGLFHACVFVATPSVRAVVLARWRGEDATSGACVVAQSGGGGDDDDDGGGGGDDGDDVGRDTAALDGISARLEDVGAKTRALVLKSLGVYDFLGMDHSAEVLSAYHQLRHEADGSPSQSPRASHEGSDGDDKASIAETYVVFFKSFIGIGILALPHGFSLSGSLGGSVGIALVVGISYYCMILLLQCRETVASMESRQTPVVAEELRAPSQQGDFAKAVAAAEEVEVEAIVGVGEASAGGAEGPQSAESEAAEAADAVQLCVLRTTYTDLGRAAYGATGAKLVDFAIVSSQLGFSTAYLIFIGHNVRAASGIESVSANGWALAAAALVCPFVWLRSLKKLSGAALFADAAIAFGLVVVLVYAARNYSSHGGDGDDEPIATDLFVVDTYPLFFGIAVFTFEGAGVVLPIQSAMREPQRFPQVLRNGTMGVTALYIGFSLMCYLAFGRCLRYTDLVTTALPKGSPVVITMQLLYCAGLFLTFPIMMWPAVQILERSRAYAHLVGWLRCCGGDGSDGDHDPYFVKSSVFRTLLVAMCASVAVSVPRFGLFVNLIGAVTCSLIAFILPGLFFNKLHARGDGGRSPKVSACSFAINYLCVFFGVVGGTVSAVMTIIELKQALSESPTASGESSDHLGR